MDLFAFKNRGGLYKKLKLYDKALKDFERAIQLDPLYESPYEERGNVYAEVKNYDKALDDYAKAIELNPKYGFTYESRAKVYRKLGLVKEAEADERKWREYLRS